MRLLFVPLHLPSRQGGITLPNRLVVAAMGQHQELQRTQCLGVGFAR